MIPSDEFSRLIRSRRTAHSFLAEPAPESLLVEAIDLAVWAPNHKLTEPWRFHLIGPRTARQIVELNAEITAAGKGPSAADEKRRRWSEMPGWFAVSCRLHGNSLRRDEDYAACCCAVQNLALFLWSHGVGIKWTTGEVTRHPEFLRLLGLAPEADRIVGLFWYGFPSAVPEQNRRPAVEFTIRHP